MVFKFDAYFSDIFGILGKTPAGGGRGGLTPKGKSRSRPTLSVRVIG